MIEITQPHMRENTMTNAPINHMPIIKGIILAAGKLHLVKHLTHMPLPNPPESDI